MKARWNLEVDSTKQVLGGFMEVTKDMTEKQMIAYVRKICREMLLANRTIDKYGIWAENEDNEDHSLHITAERHPHGYIDIMVYDSQKNDIVIDTYRDRLNRQREKDAEEMRKFNETLNALCC